MSGFTCASCGHRLGAPDVSAQQVQCPQCGQVSAVTADAVAGSTEPDTALSVHKPEGISPLFLGRGAAELNPKITAGFGGNGPNDMPNVFEFLSPAQQPGEIGRLGAYRIHKVLGTGGMGIVFQAEDGHLKRLVALKVLKPALAANVSFRQRFLREARAIAAVKNDHIVNIYQVDLDNGLPYLAMEFLEGETLESRLERDKRLPLAEVLRLGREAAEGLAAAHARELVHRDIKPANIWLESRRGRVKILDFGLARGTGADPNLTETGLILGTPYYMAPEQARGQPVDVRCDLFSLGCVLYKAASGVLPFAGTDTMSVLSALAMHEPPSLKERNPQVPPALSDLVSQLLAKDPAARTASAQAVIEVIEIIERELPAKLSDSGKVVGGIGDDYLWTGKAPSGVTTAIRPTQSPRRVVGYALGCVLILTSLLFVFGKHHSPDPTTPTAEEMTQAELEALEHRLADPKADREQLREDVRAFRDRHLATPQAERAAEILKQLPSPLDELDPAKIPEEERNPKLQGLVGVLKGHVGPVWTVSFTPDGKKLASGGGGGTDHSVRIWNLAGREPKAGPVFGGHESTVTGVTFSLDGKRLASSSLDGTVRIWGLGGDAAKRFVLHGDGRTGIWCVAIAPDSKTLACGEGRDVRLWDLSADKEPARRHLLKGHTNQVNSIAFSRDGRTLATASADQTVLLWDLTGAAPKQKQVIKGQASGVTSVAFTLDAKTMATGSDDHTVWLWNVAAKEPRELTMLDGHVGKVNSVTFAPDGKSLLSAGNDRHVILWNIPAGNRLREWQFPDIVHRAAFAPSGRHIAVAHDDGTIYILRLSPQPTK